MSLTRLGKTTSTIKSLLRGARTLSSTSDDDYLRMILTSRVYDVSRETPLDNAPSLSAALNNNIYFKREDLQPVFSFKIRGAYNKIASLSDEQKSRGIVCCSAGNHAQGVALSARRLGIKAKVVMPLATPMIKVKAVRHHGGDQVDIILHGKSFDEAAAEAKRLETEKNYTMILPFDDPFVIAGQGTIGLEILQQTTGKQLDAIFVCCGGGGMLAGIAAYVKRIRPEVKVIGVEACDAPGMTESLRANQRVELKHVGLFADGAAVKFVGAETFRLCSAYVDEMITVNTDEICAAIKAAFNDTRSILEPAGALAIAGVTKYIQETGITGGTFVATASGANMDFDRLRFVSERADSSETLISVVVPEEPGSFGRLYDHIHPNVVTEFSYRYGDHQQALIYMSFRSSNKSNSKQIVQQLNDAGFSTMDLTGNELAKVHTRHLAGGRSPTVADEMLYRFEFPDRPDALRDFLKQLRTGWNISLFHYRNHGADIGRVLVGFAVPDKDKERFHQYLKDVGYFYQEETHNPFYRQFLL